jgi:hypothetical protein
MPVSRRADPHFEIALVLFEDRQVAERGYLPVQLAETDRLGLKTKRSTTASGIERGGKLSPPWPARPWS